MGKWMNGYLDKLAANRRENTDAGGAQRIELQHQLGKLTARERIEYLTDPRSFEELGSLVREFRFGLAGDAKPSPSDGVIMGLARVQGIPVMVYSLDFTVMSGAIGDQGIWKIAELVEMAGKQQMPVIGIFDSAGSRISFKNGYVGLNGMGRLMRNCCLYSGIIPQIALVLGPCTGPMAQVPVLADFLIINAKTGFLWWGGDIASDDAGSAEFHMQKSGQCDLMADSDEQAIDMVKQLLQFIPPNCWQKPAAAESTDDPERSEEALLDVMPDDPKFTYDIHEIIDLIVDNGEFFELKEDFAPNLVTGFARFDGMVTGIAASNPDELSGIMEPNSSDKYDRFLMYLDAFNIPLINLVDVPGYFPGATQEHAGIIRHGAKMLYAYAEATVPKITLALRKEYGGAVMGMCCVGMGVDLMLAWPIAQLVVLDTTAAVNLIFRKDIAAAENPEAFRQQKIEEYDYKYSNPYHAASNMLVDSVIKPRETRPQLIKALRMLKNKHRPAPNKRHGNIPL